MKEELYGLANHIAGAKGGLPQEWQEWADEIEMDIRKLANREAQPVGYASGGALMRMIRGQSRFCSVFPEPTREYVIGVYLEPQIGPPAPAVPDDYQHLKNVQELYHRQEKRLFALAQRIKGASFDKYSHTTAQAIDVLEREIFGDDGDACRAAMLAQPVSGGYKLVPVEATEDMIAAAMNCDDVEFNADETFCVNFGNIYAAMLAAAPEGGNG
ncbi:Uncharacterised protein [Serratia marcescens]|uniref:hypothetical protein n=1 Tax=Serratia marcescens TaxID=615 RepID=UPI000744FE81|nr:hypothetical protein [Serratia marcescens]CVB02974.1 Uncharacterised protein [Serratia marcescens]CVC53251.1 Uncharacterised protein [Serratia marcescens]